RREGLARFRGLEADIAAAFAAALPSLAPADDARIRAEEERVRAAMRAVGAEEGGAANAPAAPATRPKTPGRNDLVTIRRGSETQTLKYKKAEPLLKEGWALVSE
ncbi:MAG: hypothetical protein KGI78_03655, partial [Patescibacteria group bacterium]|nr:hypothetical protein [Patescibacteria group bacterium]